MDPQVAWDELLEALADSDLEQAEVRAEALLEWTGRNGFPPQTVSGVLPTSWDRKICRYVCRKVLAEVAPPWE